MALQILIIHVLERMPRRPLLPFFNVTSQFISIMLNTSTYSTYRERDMSFRVPHSSGPAFSYSASADFLGLIYNHIYYIQSHHRSRQAVEVLLCHLTRFHPLPSAPHSVLFRFHTCLSAVDNLDPARLRTKKIIYFPWRRRTETN